MEGNVTSTGNWFTDAGNYILELGINEVIGLSAAALFLITFLGSDKTIQEISSNIQFTPVSVSRK